MRIVGLVLLMGGTAAFCFGGLVPAPEVDPASGGAAIALVGGALMVLRARKKKS